MRATPTALVAGAFVIALAFAPTAVASAPSAWDPPIDVSDPSDSTANPQLLTDGTTMTAVWVGADGGGGGRVHVSMSTDGGSTWNTPVIISPAGGDAHTPQVMSNGAVITAAWARFDDGRVESSSSTDGGATWTAPVTLSPAGGDAYAPELVSTGAAITAVWQRFDGTNNYIQSSSSTDNGATWSTPVSLSDVVGTAYGAQVVTDGAVITAVWQRFDGSNEYIQSSSSTDSGATWSTPVSLSDVVGNAFGPQVVTDGATITATWVGSDGSNTRVEASSSTDGGSTWSAPVAVSAAGGDAYGAQVASNGATITATWYRDDGSNTRVEASSSTDGGSTWSAPVALSSAGGNVYGPQVATEGSTVIVTWSQFDGGNDRVQVSSSNDGGVTWSAPVILSAAGGDAYDSRPVLDGATTTVIWRRFDGSSERVQASSFTFEGGGAAPGSELPATGAVGALTSVLLAGGLVLGGAALVALRARGRHA